MNQYDLLDKTFWNLKKTKKFTIVEVSSYGMWGVFEGEVSRFFVPIKEYMSSGMRFRGLDSFISEEYESCN